MGNSDIQTLVSASVGSEMVASEALRELLTRPDGHKLVEAVRERVLTQLKTSDIVDEQAHRYLEVLAPAIDSANLIIDRALREHG